MSQKRISSNKSNDRLLNTHYLLYSTLLYSIHGTYLVAGFTLEMCSRRLVQSSRPSSVHALDVRTSTARFNCDSRTISFSTTVAAAVASAPEMASGASLESALESALGVVATESIDSDLRDEGGDVSTGNHSLVRSIVPFAPLHHSLAPHCSYRSRALRCAYSLAHSLTPSFPSYRERGICL